MGIEGTLAALRFAVAIPVGILALAALGAFFYAAVVLVRAVGHAATHLDQVAPNVAHLLSVVDLCLIGATLLIAAIGLYELFVSRVDSHPSRALPSWLLMRDLNDLKARIVAMIVLVAAATFIEVLVEFPSPHRVLETGVGIGAVVVALTAFLRFSGREGPGGSQE